MCSSAQAWRFLNTGFGNAFFNMAVDEALVRSVSKGSLPVFRVYGWQPPAVSFGYAQRIEREIDAEACRNRNIDIVRRTTGGRAVLHWNELTYSAICASDNPIMGGSIQEAYRKISTGLMAGVRRLGIDVAFESRRREQPSPRGKELTSPCFTSTAQYEVTHDNRKLIGSAQQRIGHMLLQHGSLLLGSEHKQIIGLLPKGKERLHDRFARELDRQTVSLSEALKRPVPFETGAMALYEGLVEAFDIEWLKTELSSEERAEAERLVVGKYGDDDWNYRH